MKIASRCGGVAAAAPNLRYQYTTTKSFCNRPSPRRKAISARFAPPRGRRLKAGFLHPAPPPAFSLFTKKTRSILGDLFFESAFIPSENFFGFLLRGRKKRAGQPSFPAVPPVCSEGAAACPAPRPACTPAIFAPGGRWRSPPRRGSRRPRRWCFCRGGGGRTPPGSPSRQSFGSGSA